MHSHYDVFLLIMQIIHLCHHRIVQLTVLLMIKLRLTYYCIFFYWIQTLQVNADNLVCTILLFKNIIDYILHNEKENMLAYRTTARFDYETRK